MTQEKWGQLRSKLLKAVGRNNFTTWIEPLEFQELQDGVAIFSVPTNFMGNYVSQNFADLILYELNTSGESVQRLAFQTAANSSVRPVQISETKPTVTTTAAVSAPETPPNVLEALQAAPLDARLPLTVLWLANQTNWLMQRLVVCPKADRSLSTLWYFMVELALAKHT